MSIRNIANVSLCLALLSVGNGVEIGRAHV